MDLLDKLKIAGGDRATTESLLLLDTELRDDKDEAELAREVSVDNP